jgi:hypothetical protein
MQWSTARAANCTLAPRSGERVASAEGASRVRGSLGLRKPSVTRGLDPRVHPLRKNFFANRMDCRVKPGNDDCDCCSRRPLTRPSLRSGHPLPATRGEGSSARRQMHQESTHIL